VTDKTSGTHDEYCDSRSDDSDADAHRQFTDAEAEDHIANVVGKPTPDDSTVLDDSIERLKDSREIEEADRILRVGKSLDTFVDRLDRFEDIDDAWRFWLPPKGNRPERRPPLKERWCAAKLHRRQLLLEIKETSTAAFGFQHDRDIRVCLKALDHEIRNHEVKYLELGDKGGRPSDAIELLKQILERAQWRISPTLVQLAAKTKITAEEIREQAFPKYLPAHITVHAGDETQHVQPSFDLESRVWLGSRELAEIFGFGKGALDTKLARFRNQTPEGKHWRRQDDRAKDEPECVHRLSSVRPILQKMRPAHENDP